MKEKVNNKKSNLRRKRKIKVKTKKIANSFKYAFQGIITSFKTERNMKFHVFIMIMVILAGFWLKISTIEWIICIILFGLVIGAELFNTAIEKTVDIAMPYRNPDAKIAKDVAAASVLVVSISAAIIGFIIFIPKINEMFNK